MGRNYQKKNLDYWAKMSQPKSVQSQETTFAAQGFIPESLGDNFAGLEISTASTRGSSGSSGSGSRMNRSAVKSANDRYSQIRQMHLPFEHRDGGVDMRDAIELCQKAYANVSAFKNAIDLMSEFSNTEIYLKGGNKASRDFFDAWLKRIDIWSLRRHYFFEYFRSSNVFLYRLDADWQVEDLIKLRTIYANDAKIAGKQIPIKYILINPYNIASNSTTVFYDGMYEQILSQNELARLKNPITDDDKRIFDSLPQEAKDLISKQTWTKNGIKIKIDPKKLHVSFAKKQPYEPFAIPFGYSVLGDINVKLEMKALDLAIMRTVEMAILHVTHGEKKDQHGGGISQATGEALKQIFSNGTVGRTLITDYTTKAEFIIPDLKKVLGPEKYQIINQDIREGLQNIIVGEEKYGNTQAKINVFLEKLRESRQSFLNDFLQPEVKRIAKEMGFRVYPECHFTDISLQDNTELMRIANRLVELGILSPQELMNVFQRGEFPSAEEIGSDQEQYISERKKGKWMPLSPVPIVAAPAPKLDPNKAQSASQNSSAKPIGKPAGRPTSSKASIEDIREVTFAAQNLENYICQKLGENLSAEQKSLAHELTVQIVASKESGWTEAADSCLEDLSEMMKLQIDSEILALSAETGMDIFASALYFRAAK